MAADGYWPTEHEFDSWCVTHGLVYPDEFRWLRERREAHAAKLARRRAAYAARRDQGRKAQA